MLSAYFHTSTRDTYHQLAGLLSVLFVQQFPGCSGTVGIFEKKRRQTRTNGVDRERERARNCHWVTRISICSGILELSPGLPRQMHPLAALNSIAYALAALIGKLQLTCVRFLSSYDRFIPTERMRFTIELDCWEIHSQLPIVHRENTPTLLFQSVYIVPSNPLGYRD